MSGSRDLHDMEMWKQIKFAHFKDLRPVSALHGMARSPIHKTHGRKIIDEAQQRGAQEMRPSPYYRLKNNRRQNTTHRE